MQSRKIADGLELYIQSIWAEFGGMLLGKMRLEFPRAERANEAQLLLAEHLPKLGYPRRRAVLNRHQMTGGLGGRGICMNRTRSHRNRAESARNFSDGGVDHESHFFRLDPERRVDIGWGRHRNIQALRIRGDGTGIVVQLLPAQKLRLGTFLDLGTDMASESRGIIFLIRESRTIIFNYL